MFLYLREAQILKVRVWFASCFTSLDIACLCDLDPTTPSLQAAALGFPVIRRLLPSAMVAAKSQYPTIVELQGFNVGCGSLTVLCRARGQYLPVKLVEGQTSCCRNFSQHTDFNMQILRVQLPANLPAGEFTCLLVNSLQNLWLPGFGSSVLADQEFALHICMLIFVVVCFWLMALVALNSRKGRSSKIVQKPVHARPGRKVLQQGPHSA